MTLGIGIIPKRLGRRNRWPRTLLVSLIGQDLAVFLSRSHRAPAAERSLQLTVVDIHAHLPETWRAILKRSRRF
jgi:hypothetical protein